MALGWKSVTSLLFLDTNIFLLSAQHFSHITPAARIKICGCLIFYGPYIWLKISATVLFYHIRVKASHLPGGFSIAVTVSTEHPLLHLLSLLVFGELESICSSCWVCEWLSRWVMLVKSYGSRVRVKMGDVQWHLPFEDLPVAIILLLWRPLASISIRKLWNMIGAREHSYLLNVCLHIRPPLCLFIVLLWEDCVRKIYLNQEVGSLIPSVRDVSPEGCVVLLVCGAHDYSGNPDRRIERCIRTSRSMCKHIH